jgi:hypothetical protein
MDPHLESWGTILLADVSLRMRLLRISLELGEYY